MRCFIGVPVDHHLALSLLGERDRAMTALASTRPREVEAANFHLTLAFLGELPAEAEPALLRLMGSVAVQRPFLQPLTRARCFPRPGARLFAVEGEPAPEMLALSRRLELALVRNGFPVEGRRIRPHVTLLRLGLSPVRSPEWEVDLAAPVRELVLYQSVPGQRGNDYLPRGTVPLRSGA